jgi:hypothetical protein
MSRTIHSGYNQYIAPGSSTTLHSTSGKLRSLLLTGESTTIGSITIYDNTVASGNVLYAAKLRIDAPITIILPLETPMIFETGLTVVTDANASAFLLTEV